MSFFDTQIHAVISDALEVFIFGGLVWSYTKLKPQIDSVKSIVSAIKTEYDLAGQNYEVMGGKISKKVADKVADQVVKPD